MLIIERGHVMWNFFKQVTPLLVLSSRLTSSSTQKEISTFIEETQTEKDNSLYEVYTQRFLPLIHQLATPDNALYPVALHLDQASKPYLNLSSETIKREGLPSINFAVAHGIGAYSHIQDFAKLINTIAEKLDEPVHIILDGEFAFLPPFLKKCVFYGKQSDTCVFYQLTEKSRQFLRQYKSHFDFEAVQRVFQQDGILFSYGYFNNNATLGSIKQSLKNYLSRDTVTYSTKKINYLTNHYGMLISRHTIKGEISSKGFKEGKVFVHTEDPGILSTFFSKKTADRRFEEIEKNINTIKFMFRSGKILSSDRKIFCQLVTKQQMLTHKDLARNRFFQRKSMQIKSNHIRGVFSILAGANHYSIKHNEPAGFYINNGITFWENNVREQIEKSRHSVFPDDYEIVLLSDLERTSSKEKKLYVGLKNRDNIILAVSHQGKLYHTLVKKSLLYLEKSEKAYPLSGTLQEFLKIKEEIFLTSIMHDFVPIDVEHFRHLKDRFCQKSIGPNIQPDENIKFEL